MECKIGILPGVDRSKSGHRRYSDLDLSLIRLVRCLRGSGMPIEQLRRYADLAQQGDHTADALALVERKIAYYEEIVDTGPRRASSAARGPGSASARATPRPETPR